MLAERYGTSRFARLMACIIAIAAATPNAITATQMCAKTRRFAGPRVEVSASGCAPSATRRPVSSAAMFVLALGGRGRCGRVPLRSGDNVQLGCHRVMADTAVLIAGDQV